MQVRFISKKKRMMGQTIYRDFDNREFRLELRDLVVKYKTLIKLWCSIK